MKKRIFLVFIILVIFFTVICSLIRLKLNDRTPMAVSKSNAVDSNIQMMEVKYNKNGIAAEYPQFITDRIKDKFEHWNQILQMDFDKILEIYSFNPIPGPPPSPSGAIPEILRINYDIKINDANYVSILYKAAYNSPYSAHPSELVYTTNINKEKDRRVMLKDFINLNKDFVKDFKTWDFITYDNSNKELVQAVKDYMNQMSEEDLLKGFLEADQIGSKNLWGIYSYFTPNKLGISLEVPNYLGDHIEFEREYNRLQKYLKPDTQIP